MEAIIFTDGACLGNPGRMGAGIVILSSDGTELLAKGVPLGMGTNNVAELSAVLHALEEARKLHVTIAHVKLDSEWTCKALTGKYRVQKEHLIPIYEKVKSVEKKFGKVTYEWIPREENSRADELSKIAAQDV